MSFAFSHMTEYNKEIYLCEVIVQYSYRIGIFASPRIVVSPRVNYIVLFLFDVPRIVEGVKIQHNFRHFGRSTRCCGCEGTLHLETAIPMTSSSGDIFSTRRVEIRQSYDLLRNIGLRFL